MKQKKSKGQTFSYFLKNFIFFYFLLFSCLSHA
nr:MAG TPA: hypothetical protein [Caudoviricetes sp.]